MLKLTQSDTEALAPIFQLNGPGQLSISHWQTYFPLLDTMLSSLKLSQTSDVQGIITPIALTSRL